MKLNLLIGISLILAGSMAHAKTIYRRPQHRVLCTPKIQAIGTTVAVTVDYGRNGGLVAQVNIGGPSYGRPGHIETYDVKSSENFETSLQTLAGKDFELNINTVSGEGELKAKFQGYPLNLENLQCEEHWFDPYPAVSGSN